MKHRFEKTELIGAALVALFGIALIAIAAAGAPKKGPLACAKDLWTCGDWSVCSGAMQTRTCAMTYDCPSVATPKPDETQSCVAAARGCDDASWACGDWQACDADGRQSRSCKLVKECPGVTMTRPQTARDCAQLCESGTLRERVACRLELSAAGLARLQSQHPVPEACRSLGDLAERDDCIQSLAAFASCHGDLDATVRLACARTVLGLSDDSTASDCASLSGADKTACIAALAEKERLLVIFQMDDLASYVARVHAEGSSLADAADFVSAAAQGETDYLAAVTDKARRIAVQGVQAAWKRYAGQDNAGLHDVLTALPQSE